MSVVAVIPFGEVRESLKPKFTISGDAAKNEAIQVTASQQTRSLSAVIGEVTAGIDVGSAGSAPTSPTGQPTAAAAPAAVAASEAIGSDPFTVYSAANSLNQEVVQLNQSLDWIAGLNEEGDEGVAAYVVRMSVAVLPRTRSQPFDVVADLSFLPEKENAYGVRVVPLLVTESFESVAQQQTNQILRSLAVALSANVGQAKVGGAIKAINDFVADLQARELNGLMNVSRVGENTLRIRLGAVSAVGADEKRRLVHRMVPRDHKVSALILIPKKVLPESGAKDLLRLATRVRYLRADGDPTEAEPFTRADALDELKAFFRTNLDEATYAKLDGLGSWAPILRARDEGELVKFNNLVRGIDPGSPSATQPTPVGTPVDGLKRGQRPFVKMPPGPTLQATKRGGGAAEAEMAAPPAGTDWDDISFLWNELTEIISKQSVRTETISIPVKPPRPAAALPWAADGKALLVDTGAGSSVKLALVGHDLKPAAASAGLTVKTKAVAADPAAGTPARESVDVFVPASGVTASDGGRSLTFAFPSLQASPFDLDTIRLVYRIGETRVGPVALHHLAAKPASGGPIALKFNRSDIVRTPGGRSSGPVQFTLVPDPQAAAAGGGLAGGTALGLKVSGASNVQIVEGTTPIVPAEIGVYPVTLGKSYSLALEGIDPRTPVTLQVLQPVADAAGKVTFKPLGDPRQLAVVD